MEELVIILVRFILSPFLYLLGLFRLWHHADSAKSFKRVVAQNSFQEVVRHGKILSFDLFSVAGIVVLCVLVVTAVATGLWFVGKAIIQ
jgi:hypothetical protein